MPYLPKAYPRGYSELDHYVDTLLKSDENAGVSGRIEPPMLPDMKQKDDSNEHCTTWKR